MLWVAWNANKLPPRVRSKGISPTDEFGLASNPALAHFVGSVRLDGPAGSPLLSRQTGLNVGSVMPKPKFSNSRVCFISMPIFRSCGPDERDRSLLTPQFRS